MDLKSEHKKQGLNEGQSQMAKKKNDYMIGKNEIRELCKRDRRFWRLECLSTWHTSLFAMILAGNRLNNTDFYLFYSDIMTLKIFRKCLNMYIIK